MASCQDLCQSRSTLEAEITVLDAYILVHQAYVQAYSTQRMGKEQELNAVNQEIYQQGCNCSGTGSGT